MWNVFCYVIHSHYLPGSARTPNINIDVTSVNECQNIVLHFKLNILLWRTRVLCFKFIISIVFFDSPFYCGLKYHQANIIWIDSLLVTFLELYCPHFLEHYMNAIQMQKRWSVNNRKKKKTADKCTYKVRVNCNRTSLTFIRKRCMYDKRIICGLFRLKFPNYETLPRNMKVNRNMLEYKWS